jgi:simple sugar transport system ATP-binding protein
MSPAPLLSLKGIRKQYPAVLANDNISLDVMPGQIHAILGENGAGKSTLMKIIFGAVQPDAGDIRFNGQAVRIRNPQQARQLGISMVFQHFSLFDTLSVAQNVWLGLDKSLSLAEVTQRIRDKAAIYGLDIEPERPVHTLSVGEMQRVEIIRALLCEPRLLILDEPTSVLTPQAVDKLFAVLRQLVAEGCSILYISHKLHEIRALCTHCTVLRAGRVSGACIPSEETNASLSQMMIGSEPPALDHQTSQPGAVVLEVRQLQLARQDPFGMNLSPMDLQVRQGEIVGIAGVSGNGQREWRRHPRPGRLHPLARSSGGFARPNPAACLGLALCARRALGSWCRAQPELGAQPVAHAFRRHQQGGLDRHERPENPGRVHHQPLQGQGWGCPCLGAVVVGRQFAKVHCRARN